MTTVSVNFFSRETLSEPDAKARVAQFQREILAQGDPNVRVVEFFREILHSLPQGQFQALTCQLAEVYFNPGAFIDFSDSANRALFHDADLHPVSLGSDGSVPTGSVPLLYLTIQSLSLTPNPYDFPVNASGNGSMDVITTDNGGLGYGVTRTAPSD